MGARLGRGVSPFRRALARLTSRVPNESGSQVLDGTPQEIDGGMDAQGSGTRAPLVIEVVHEGKHALEHPLGEVLVAGLELVVLEQVGSAIVDMLVERDVRGPGRVAQ